MKYLNNFISNKKLNEFCLKHSLISSLILFIIPPSVILLSVVFFTGVFILPIGFILGWL